MVSVIYLLVRAHEIDRAAVLKYRSVAVIPLAVKFDEIPIVIAPCYGISLDHHVGDSCLIKEHLAACVVNIAVTASSGKSSVSCSLIGKSSSDMRVIDIAVNPVEDSSCRLDLAASPKACHDLGSHLVCSRFLA